MNKFLLSLSYNGTNYHGWVVQKKMVTVQETLNQTIKRVIKKTNFKTIGASKTDAGVHALDQKVLLICDFKPKDLSRFCTALNKALPNDLWINSLIAINSDFNFHQAVKQKTYLYTINDQNWNLKTQPYEYFVPDQFFEVEKLQLICNLFLGQHDFRNFCGLKVEELKKINPVRTIDVFKVHRINHRIVFEIKGQGFIRYQIRMMIGAILKVYQHQKYHLKDLEKLLNGQEFFKIPFIVPPNGLCLKKIILQKPWD